MENQVKCPKCASTQISANKKGFSAGQAATGALLFGGVGLLAGTAGSGNVKITCLNCGHVFKPGDKALVVRQRGKYDDIAWIVFIVCTVATLVLVVYQYSRN